jgi:hypothetical protein
VATAAAAWRFCLTRFAHASSPDWLTELARAGRMLGHDAEAIAIWGRALLAFPQNAAPGWYQSVTALCGRLGRTGQADATMLDVSPLRLLDAGGTPTAQASNRYYDANYEWLGQPRAPYTQPAGVVRVRVRLFQVP